MLAGESAFLLLSPTGGVRYASAGARGYLELPGLAERLGDVVRTVDRATDRAVAEESSGRFVFQGVDIRLTRLVSERKVAYLACARKLPLPHCSPASQLTPTQQEVALCAVSGATVEEIAHALGKRAGTVRTHLRNIYQTLHVSSRVELARVLGSVGDVRARDHDMD